MSCKCGYLLVLDLLIYVHIQNEGVPLIDGGTVRLPALIGLSRALDMILTGRPVHAKEALEIGKCQKSSTTVALHMLVLILVQSN